MKVERKNFKGIEYVLFDELPQEQKDKLIQTLSRDTFIKIMIDGQVVSKCIQYRDYSNWFDRVYRPSTAIAVVQKAVVEKIAVPKNLALNEF